MKHRKPRPINFKRRLPAHLRNDPQVIKWSKRLLGDRKARPTDLSEEQLAFVVLEVTKRRADRGEQSARWLDHDLFLKAMSETTPALAAPRLDRPALVEDLAAMLSQPEMRAFWEGWEGERARKGPQPDFTTGKALATVMGMSGISAHADDCYTELTGNRKMWELVERLNGADRELEPTSYQNALKQLPRLACHDRCIATNLAMVRALRELYPDAGIGERLMIDGMGVPAWCEQAPKGKTEEEEAHRRRFCPEAGARAYIHTSNGKREVNGNANARLLTKARFWRGYYAVAIVDQASGLPLVWTTMDAAGDEAEAIIPLLSDLYRYWPNCPAEVIVGDSAWDEKRWCRVLEVDYGIHPVFRLHDEDSVPNISGFSRDGAIKEITSHGQLVCSHHGKPLPMKSAEGPRRVDPQTGEPLRGGQTTDERRFRVRASCRKGCGDVGLRMEADWRRLTYYPHHGVGGQAIKWRYAMRTALLTRLNGMEAIWLRLQGGKKLGTNDADRTRLREKSAHEMALDLALLSMTAAGLADQRAERGVDVPPLPPAPPAPRPAVARLALDEYSSPTGASDAANARAPVAEAEGNPGQLADVPATGAQASSAEAGATAAVGRTDVKASTRKNAHQRSCSGEDRTRRNGGAPTSEMLVDVYAALCE